MDSLVGYGSDDDIDSDRHGPQSSVSFYALNFVIFVL